MVDCQIEHEAPMTQQANAGVLTLGPGARLLMNNAGDGITVIQDGVVKLVNRSFLETASYQENEVLSRSFMDFVHPDDRKLVAEHYSRKLMGGEIASAYTLRIMGRNGCCRWMDAKTLFVVWDGAPAVLCFLTDVSESRRLQESLRVSEERIQNLVEASTDWAWQINAGFVITYSSPQVRGLLGYRPQEVVGKSPAEFMPADEAARVYAQFAAAHPRPDHRVLYTLTFIHKRGRRVTLETSAVAVLDAGGQVVGYRGIARDVTEREDMKRQLQDGVQKLERTIDRTIQAIALIAETRDSYTAGHQKRTSELASAIAERMAVPHDGVQVVRIAALLHDIGKIAVPTEILCKPGRVSEIELALIKTHSQVGYDILKAVDFPWPIADIVCQHHERLNGSGYPRGLKEEDIVLEARILAVADVVEAMTSHRPYRPARGMKEALKEISDNSGSLYDADAVYACLDLFNKGDFAFEDITLLSEWYNA